MIKTVPEAFQEFMRRYEPTAATKEAAAAKQNYLRDSLAGHLEVMDDFLTGSYIKQTQIKPKTDIDLFLVLNPTYWHEKNLQKPRDVLSFVFHQLRKTYPRSIMRIDGQAVALIFQDGFKFDVVPAFKGNGDYFIIPSVKPPEWIPCNPKKHIDSLAKMNQAFSQTLKPLIKMAKCWKVAKLAALRSFHIELMAARIFSNLSDAMSDDLVSGYPRSLAFFFQQACHLIDEPMTDEVNRRIDEYLNVEDLREQTWVKLTYAAKVATEACHYQAIGKQRRACVLWRTVFGQSFPFVL